jgi:DNA phosphorothioation-dependent restriction protein DptG
MAHFAKLGVGNIVEQVIVISNDVATTEQAGVDFINKIYNTRDVWKQTSYNNNIRKNFAGVGLLMINKEMHLLLQSLIIVGY